MRALALLGPLALLLATNAQAGNDDEIIQGNDAALSAGAVTAVVRDGSGIWYNPAGLALADSDKLDVSANAFVVRVYRAPGLLTSGDLIADTESVPEYVVAPAAVTFVRNLGANLSAGLGIFVTKASDLSLRANLLVPAPTGDTAWLLALSRRSNLYHAGLGIGWAPDPRLRVGATVFAVYESAAGSTLFGGGLVSAEDATAFRSESLIANSSRIGLRVSGGVQWDVTDHLAVGLTVLSQGLVLESTFGSTQLASSLVGNEGGFFAAVPERAEPRFAAFAPYRVRGGIAWQADGSFVAIDVDYQTRLDRPELNVSRLPVYNFRIGGRYNLNELLAIGAGVFSDRNADPPPRAFGEGTVDLYGVTAGLTWRSSLVLKGERGDLPLTFATTLAGRYAYGRGDFLGLEVYSYGQANPPFSFVLSQLAIHELTFHLGSAIQF